MSEITYECPIHKTVHVGEKRETFQLDIHAALLNASMHTSMQLYKSVNANCHCPSNYAAFDAILASGTEHKGTKQTTT